MKLKCPLVIIATCAVLALIVIFGRFVSGFGAASYALITPIDHTPEILGPALSAAGWEQDMEKQYYLAAYEVDMQSVTPFRLGLLTAQLTKDSANVRAHALTPDFAYSLSGFEHRAYSFPFLLEVARDVSPTESMRNVDFVVRSNRSRWARIPVSVPGSLQVEERTAMQN